MNDEAGAQRAKEDRELIDEAYRIFKASFETDQKRKLASSAKVRATKIIGDVRLEIDFAKSAYETMKQNYEETHTGWMNPLVTTVLRSYRAIEWFQSELGSAVLEALFKPFSHYTGPTPKATRDVLKSSVMRAMRDAAIDEGLRMGPFAARLTQYLEKYRGARNDLAHSPYTPNGPDAFGCLVDAIGIHNEVDEHFNGAQAAPIDPPSEITE